MSAKTKAFTNVFTLSQKVSKLSVQLAAWPIGAELSTISSAMEEVLASIAELPDGYRPPRRPRTVVIGQTYEVKATSALAAGQTVRVKEALDPYRVLVELADGSLATVATAHLK